LNICLHPFDDIYSHSASVHLPSLRPSLSCLLLTSAHFLSIPPINTHKFSQC
jgi:hypothetical protein